nr:hypothetical protein [Tanacetum cinerariifolium]
MVAVPKVPMLKLGGTTEMPITTTEEKAQRRLEDAKKFLEAVEKRFSRNATTKKTQRNLLKQQYENFTTPSSKMLDQTFDRLQKLVIQLELLEEKLSQEDVNQKLLRTLSPEWNTHVVVWRSKADLDTMSMDDLYNNLKVYKPEVKGIQPNSPQLIHEDLEQIHPYDMEEMEAYYEFVNKLVVENCKPKSSEEEPKVVKKNDNAPIIEEWMSDNEEEDVSQPKIEKENS